MEKKWLFSAIGKGTTQAHIRLAVEGRLDTGFSRYPIGYCGAAIRYPGDDVQSKDSIDLRRHLPQAPDNFWNNVLLSDQFQAHPACSLPQNLLPEDTMSSISGKLSQ